MNKISEVLVETRSAGTVVRPGRGRPSAGDVELNTESPQEQSSKYITLYAEGMGCLKVRVCDKP